MNGYIDLTFDDDDTSGGGTVLENSSHTPVTNVNSIAQIIEDSQTEVELVGEHTMSQRSFLFSSQPPGRLRRQSSATASQVSDAQPSTAPGPEVIRIDDSPVLESSPPLNPTVSQAVVDNLHLPQPQQIQQQQQPQLQQQPRQQQLQQQPRQPQLQQQPQLQHQLRVSETHANGVAPSLHPAMHAGHVNYNRPGEDYIAYNNANRVTRAPGPVQQYASTHRANMTISDMTGRQRQFERLPQPVHVQPVHAMGHHTHHTHHSRFAPSHRPVPVQNYSRVNGPPAPEETPVVANSRVASGHHQRLSMLGQLRAVVTISPGSSHFRSGTTTHFPVKLKKRPGIAQEVEVFDNFNGLIGTLEQSVTRTIYALLSDGAIKVLGLMTGPLRGKFIAPILLSFYAGSALAREVVKLFERSGIYLDQSAPETQALLRELDMESNRLTQGMEYVAHHPTRDDSGLVNLDTNSDARIPSVFSDMGLHAVQEGGGGEWHKKKSVYRSLPLPEQMRVEKRKEPEEDPKARLANIKSTFVTLLDLPELDAPPQVITALRRHQKQALYFMVHRETEGVDVEEESVDGVDYKMQFPKLWRAIKGGPNGSACTYKHTLVDIKSLEKPKSLLGGILADDMGLGKTLSILSLVLAHPPTRPRAARMKFVTVNSESPDNSNYDSGTLAARSSNGRQGKRRARIARSNSQRSKKAANNRKGKGADTGPSGSNSVIDVGDDSDSFTDLPPSKRPRRAKNPLLVKRSGNADAHDSSSSVHSDSDGLVDDPMEFLLPKRCQTKAADSDAAFSPEAEESVAASPLVDSYASDSDSYSSDSYVSDGGPMTPAPEFDNMPTRKKEVCERIFAENYHGRYAGRTLIICPLSTLGNWEEQVKQHLQPCSLSVYAYHGNTRARDPRKICQYDIVLTTYNVLQAEYGREMRQLVAVEAELPQSTGAGVFDSSSEEESNTKLYQVPDEPYVSPLQAVHWHRIVLDEAHSIKERRTISSMAAYSLTADRRWCLTGTPIQNRLDDLFSLLRFLHAAPINNWRVWLTYFGAPFHENIRGRTNVDDEFEEHNIGANRVQRLMQSICLRRMKQQIDRKTNRTMIELPPKFEVVRWLELAEGERRLYQMAEDIARNKYQNMSRSGTVLKNYMSILQIILRLRQLCTHPRLWSEDKWKEAHVLAADAAIADAHTSQLPANGDATSSTSAPSVPATESKPQHVAKSESKAEANIGAKIEAKAEAKPVAEAEAKPAAKAEAKVEAKPETKPEAMLELKPNTKPEVATKRETKPTRTHIAADLCAAAMASSDLLDESDPLDWWKLEASAHGVHVKCGYCGECAIPPAMLPNLLRLGANVFPGPGITKCNHVACRKCQTILFGAAPASIKERDVLLAGPAVNTLSECVLCGEMLGLGDVTHLSVKDILQSLAAASGDALATSSSDIPVDPLSPGAAATADINKDYEELNRQCKSFDSSTKANALINDIDKIRARQWVTDSDFKVDQSHPAVQARQTELVLRPGLREKCVVFSQWTSMLDLIQPLLRQRNIRFTRLDGKMQRVQRDRNLALFKTDPEIEVLLLSLRAGGVGLNLAYATHVFLMDAFWNPSVESQAIDRIHRLGQKNPVTVTRYFIKDSIEERILKLQTRKAKVADISLMDSTRFRDPNADTDAALGNETDDDGSLAITTGTHSRQQRLDDLNMLFG